MILLSAVIQTSKISSKNLSSLFLYQDLKGKELRFEPERGIGERGLKD
jgi:hypothetical protein